MRPKVFSPESAAGQALTAWWSGLSERRGERAALARCHGPAEVVATLEFHAAFARHFAQVLDTQRLHRPAMPAVLGLLSGVRKADERRSLGKVLAQGAAGGRGLSNLRFRRLLQAEDIQDLYALLRRAIALVDRAAPLLETAELVYLWSLPEPRQRLRQNLAFDYFENLSPEQRKR